eukprot:TRINITY_DN6031_c0_g1_i1.p1 TRINITY_DN6031_c0_g1~~TRINITY_DN6031_c0_g1_i1.p1  ORF type:complete len:205 (-),score=42.90 TRINITY_DN6031_c0_g1_i1:249-863(-)
MSSAEAKAMDDSIWGWVPHKDYCYVPVVASPLALNSKMVDIDVAPLSEFVLVTNNKLPPTFKTPATLFTRSSPQVIQAYAHTDDLTNLESLEEPGILHTIRMRYAKNEIYSWIGSSVLISVNPYKQLPIFSTNYMQEFMSFNSLKTDAHIFSAAASAFANMLNFHRTRGEMGAQSQAFIVSGESGAGKTVNILLFTLEFTFFFI